jgi:hypothetical protein
MSPDAASASATLAAWREQGADRLDPMRFHVMEALATRASRHEGKARHILDVRLAELIEAYARELGDAAPGANTDQATTGAPSALNDLLTHIEAGIAARLEHADTRDALPSASYPTLEMLDQFKRLWSTLRTSSQMRQSLEQVPENAGPLNSGALVHRSIALMRELSPGYLEQFLSYADSLSWIEQINANAPATSDGARAPSTRKRAKAKPRAS